MLSKLLARLRLVIDREETDMMDMMGKGEQISAPEAEDGHSRPPKRYRDVP